MYACWQTPGPDASCGPSTRTMLNVGQNKPVYECGVHISCVNAHVGAPSFEMC